MKKAILWLLPLAFTGLTACDPFFIIHTTIIDSKTQTLLPGATGTLILDKGAAEPDHTVLSGADGSLYIFMNEPSSAWATLTVNKEGYDTWSTQFHGRPTRKFVIRLVPKEDAGSSEEEPRAE